MTQAKSGSLSVVNARGKLVGVFTDGDFRRHMATDDDCSRQPLGQVMTRNPIQHSRRRPGSRGAEDLQRAQH